MEKRAGIVVGLMLLSLGLYAYRKGRFALLVQAINGKAVINR